jgi:protein ImuB
LNKLGLRHIKDLLPLPSAALRRRFGPGLLQRINQAIGKEEEIIQPVQQIHPYTERLSSLEPIITRAGIDIAIKRLLDAICKRLHDEQKGLRIAILKTYELNGGISEITIETHRPSHHAEHLFKLFEIKLDKIQPGSGIELFVMEARQIEDHIAEQKKIWKGTKDATDTLISELLDRLMIRIGREQIRRYLPDAHYLPEHAVRPAISLDETSITEWKIERPRPIHLLSKPERIEVTAPIPDYPPMLFRYKGKLHKIIKADGPERIEQEWWLKDGKHRDYYYVEDDEGKRYWLFRSGHYTGDKEHRWFLHGFFS